MWIIEKYLKYSLIFVVIWVLLWLHRSFSCHSWESRAMEPTILASEFVTTYKKKRSIKDLQRGDVVYYVHRVKDQVEYLFGRVVALPGDKLRMVRGKLYLNDSQKPEAEIYVGENRNESDHIETIIIPRGCVFILNDNRSLNGTPRSPHMRDPADSRLFGPVPVYCVLGKTGKGTAE
jgi:signal peptidase I